MLAQPLDRAKLGVLRTGDWVYERKLDGVRCIATLDGHGAELWSRNLLSLSRRFPGVVAALAAIPIPDSVLDGEVVAFDAKGRTSFSLLQSPGPRATPHEHGTGGTSDQPAYHAFDLVRLLGTDTTGLPLSERHGLLQRALAGAPPQIVTVEQYRGEAHDLLDRACAEGWEGLVAKDDSSQYRPGRSPAWRKLKCSASQELVVGGWSEPSGTRRGFGALLLGWYDAAGGFQYAGKVGTGFTSSDIESIYRVLLSLETPSCPFDEIPEGSGLHWSTPVLVAQVRFSEWTPGGRLRHPSFLGLRDDKEPRQVRREGTGYPEPP
jgi:bifunctional non-homologous end joining protein LigD